MHKNKYLIPYAVPYVTEEDARAVYKAVLEKRLSQGLYVEQFEKEFSKYIGAKEGIAVSNGTAALHLALAALEIGPGDEVIVPSFSFISTANVVLYQRAKPVFADIDPLTLNIDPESVREKITEKTKAIIAVHYAGHPAEMDELAEISEENGLFLIEDAAEAHGSIYKGKMVGNLGHVACFSFYPNKNITTGEGGMITTNDEDLAEKIRMLRSHGQYEPFHFKYIGFNYRMTDIQAALGLVQLKRIEWVLSRKIERAKYYTRRIEELGLDFVRPPYEAPYVRHTYMFYTVQFKSKELRDKAIELYDREGVETRTAFNPPIHLQPVYMELFGYSRGFLPHTERASDTVLSLPLFVGIKEEEQEKILSILERVAGSN